MYGVWVNATFIKVSNSKQKNDFNAMQFYLYWFEIIYKMYIPNEQTSGFGGKKILYIDR